MVFITPDVPVRGTYSVDIYHTEERVPTKADRVIILVHGGAFMLGNKSVMSSAAKTLCIASGAVVVVPTYSLSKLNAFSSARLQVGILMTMGGLLCTTRGIIHVGLSVLLISITLALLYLFFCHGKSHQHPSHVNDIARVICWVDCNLMPHSLFLVGHSAGGHLVSLVATNTTYLQQVCRTASIPNIAGVIAISGVYSDRRLEQTLIGTIVLRSVFGHRAEYIDSFPIYHVGQSTPPHFFVNAEYDFSLKQHTLDMYLTMLRHNRQTTYKSYVNQDHFSIRKLSRHENQGLVQDIVEFMERHTHSTVDTA